MPLFLHMNDFQHRPGHNPSRPGAQIKLHDAVGKKGGPFECKCGKTFKSKSNATRHCRVEAIVHKIECPFGDYKTKRSDHLINHFKAKHRDQYHVRCMTCDKWIFTWAGLVPHYNHSIKCGICGLTFHDSAAYEEHVGDSIITGCSSIMCKICRMTFQDPDALEEHMRHRHPRPRHDD